MTDKNDITPLGQKLKAAREELGMTQQQLAEAVHITKSAICNFERGRRTPSIKQLQILANHLGVPLFELVDEDDARNGQRPIELERAEELLARLKKAQADLHAKQEALLLAQKRVATSHSLFDELLPIWDKLNKRGRKEARKRLAELSELQKYNRRHDER